MGCVKNISAYEFPKQSEYVNRRVQVCFNFDATRIIDGKILRDDREEPFETIIELADGRIVLGTECQYSIIGPKINEK